MKRMACLAVFLITAASAAASEPTITMKVRDFAGKAVMSLPPSKVYEITLEAEGCHILLTVDIVPGGRMYVASLSEYCDGVSEDVQSVFVEKLFEKAFESTAMGERRHIGIDRMSATSFECRMIRYASTSEEWKALLKKYGNKPMHYHEITPDPLTYDFGEFIRKSGLLRNLESVFGARGFRLKKITIGDFRATTLKHIALPEHRKCVAEKPIVGIVPEIAELVMVFEAIEPTKEGVPDW